MIRLSVPIYIQESSLPDHNLFSSTSNLCCLNLAKLPKTWFNLLVGLPPPSHFSAPYSCSSFLVRLSLQPTLVAFEFRLIGVSTTVSKSLWSQNCNQFCIS